MKDESVSDMDVVEDPSGIGGEEPEAPLFASDSDVVKRIAAAWIAVPFHDDFGIDEAVESNGPSIVEQAHRTHGHGARNEQ